MREVPVYEYLANGYHVMRRRSDDWINATHILKVADFDKPARTRILEREVQKGIHEKVQGGYGKYQGTWVPLHNGRLLAERNGVLDKLYPIFDFVPGERSPPPAPKHATAASNKPKLPRQNAQQRKTLGKDASRGPYKPARGSLRMATAPQQGRSRMSDVSYDTYSNQLNDEETPENGTVVSESDEDMSRYYPYSRKRKRGMDQPQPQLISVEEQQHIMWSDELLDYFVLQNTDDPIPAPPEPPPSINLDRAVDDKGHTPMHWAVAMGDMNVVQDLVQRGARIDTPSSSGETPLMRAVMFTNNYEKSIMGQLMTILHPSVGQKDWFGSTVFHHLTAMTGQKSRYPVAKYYLDTVLSKLAELYPPLQISQVLDLQDQAGDTAILIAARNGARKCVRALIAAGASISLPNDKGQTADEVIKELNARRRDRARQGSSSPLPQPNGLPDHHRSPSGLRNTSHRGGHYRSEAATLLSSQLPNLIAGRAEALAAALEAELAERELEAREGDRLLQQRRLELEALRKQSQALALQDEDDLFDHHEQEELDALMRESKSLIEAEQAAQLEKLMKTEETKQSQVNGLPTSDEVEEKLQFAKELARQQQTRKALIHEVVAAQSLAGVGERQEVYKRLITVALNVRAEDVEAMLPDVLNELEEAQDEAAVDANGDVNMNGLVVAPARMETGMGGNDRGLMMVDSGRGALVGLMG